jgi:hypothetical protein
LRDTSPPWRWRSGGLAHFQGHLFAAVRIDHNELAAVACNQLFVGVHQFDAADRAGFVDIDEEVAGDFDGLDHALPLADTDVGDVGFRIIAQFHEWAFQKYLTITVIANQR